MHRHRPRPTGEEMKHRTAPPWRRYNWLAAGILMWSAAVHAADLSVGISADVTSLDPHYVATQHNVAIGWNVFDALTRVDEKARVNPGLATSCPAVDPTTWEFKLR